MFSAQFLETPRVFSAPLVKIKIDEINVVADDTECDVHESRKAFDVFLEDYDSLDKEGR